MCIPIGNTDEQCKLHACSRAPKARALGQPGGMGGGGGGRGVQDGGDTGIPVADSC